VSTQTSECLLLASMPLQMWCCYLCHKLQLQSVLCSVASVRKGRHLSTVTQHEVTFLLQRMEDCGVAPDTRTLNCVVDALHDGRQPELLLSLVQHMKAVRRLLEDPACWPGKLRRATQLSHMYTWANAMLSGAISDALESVVASGRVQG
jgi:hypothetical protein